jgi:hypothetical protein
MRKELKDYLNQLEADIKPIDEFSVGTKIKELTNGTNEKITDKQELAEYIAFNFLPDYSHKETSWGTYYGPMFILPNKEGQMVEFPSMSQLDDEIFNYWRERANTSKHPSLALRYADLVVDFEPVSKKVSIDYALAQKVIDSTIEICSKSLDDGLGCKTKLERALVLSKSINDSGRIEGLKKLIIETENKFAEDNKPGLWGYAFDWLLLKDNGKIVLTEEEKNSLVDGLEGRLSKLISLGDPDPWFVECAVVPLAEYYSKIKNETSLKVVLDKFEATFRGNKYANSDGLLILNYLEKLSDIYSRFAQFEFSKKAADRIRAEISNIGDRGKFDGHEISTEITFKKEEIDKFLDSIFVTINPIEQVIPKLVVSFIIKRDNIDKQLKDISSKYVFRYIVTNKIISEFNYPIAQIGPINEDYDRHLLQHYSQSLNFRSPFLKWAFDEFKKNFSPEDLYNEMAFSPVFRPADKEYTLKLLKAFWQNDFLVFSSLTIPLVEDAIRNLCKLNGISTIKVNEDNGYDEKPLRELIKFGVLKSIFGKNGKNIEYYFCVLLTSRIGWNLRNNFAHGINKNALSDESIANRLFHILLCLSVIRKNDKEDKPNE